MPTYEYACSSCGEHLEVVQSFRDEPLTVCPSCNGSLRKVFGSVGIVFKGSGFYKTDSRPSRKPEKTQKTEKTEKTEQPEKTAAASDSSGSKSSDGSTTSSGSGSSEGGKSASKSKPAPSAAAS